MGKKKACLIGLGQITQSYIAGLAVSELGLCAVADTNESAVSRSMYAEYPFYADYRMMLATEKPEYAIISTPPQSHFEIAKYCLEQGVGIIIEKPVVLCREDWDVLEKLAEEKGLVFHTLFHWLGGIETRAVADRYDPAQIQKLEISVMDPYCDDGKSINEDRRPLMGAWIDSGVNALSMIHLWLPIRQVEVVSTQVQKCPQTQLPVYVAVELMVDGVPTKITVDWREGKNHKESRFLYRGRWVRIDHSGQYIDDDGITEYGRMSRMQEHYYHLFSQMELTSNADFSRDVHEILYKVDAAL